MEIFCAVNLNQAEKKYLLQKVEKSLVHFQSEITNDPLSYFLNCDICFGNVPRSWIERSKKLRWLQLESVGYESYFTLKNKNLRITNLKGFFSVPVAESAISGILSLLRGTNNLCLLKESKKWEGSNLRPFLRTLEGSKVLILGAGGIGQQLKKLLIPFNCRISFYDKYNQQAQFSRKEELNHIIPDSDIVIGCLPESPETVHLLNEERLNMLKPSAIVVNVGRGSLIDEEVLVQKLMNRDIAGAVLDVTSIEPLPSDHLLWNCPNTILSQHTAGGFDKEIIGKIDIFLQNLEHYIKNEPLINVIK
ncbi:MAG: D-2-hydroxyacid dehydrogenase [Prolixibacteraceae bacterium]|nr:D-2-hydroxyacid dehydrogenase [Prolixibacteraceae bacterium]